jgi:hypothetical protein
MTDLTVPPGQLRVGDAEREQVADQLAEHHAAGRLTLPELDERLTATLSARTRTELDRMLTDLPAPSRTAASPAPVARPARELPSAAAVGWRAHLASYVAVILGLWLVWALTGGGHPWPVWPMLGWGMGLLGHRTGMTACGSGVRRALPRG